MVWTKPEKELKDFMNKLNQIHSSIKCDYKIDYKRIELIDILGYVSQQNKL